MRQRPRKMNQLRMGRLSYQATGLAQEPQCEPGVTTEISRGMRYTQTLRKLPQMEPNTKTMASMAGEVQNSGATSDRIWK